MVVDGNVENIRSIHDFAFCGTTQDYNNTLERLALMAEDEKWTVKEDSPYGILSYYINGTFKQCLKQEKFLCTDDLDFCCFNTGLLTPNGNDILAVFQKNTRPDAQKWVLKYFADKTERKYMDHFPEIPELASYTSNYEELHFNPNLEIVISTDHILDDNWERIYQTVHLSKNIVKSLMIGVVEEAKRRIKRNTRLVVPQYYNNRIMYLLPIKIPIEDDTYVTMALAVELTQSNQYRANTIFTKEMAYEKARLLMKPESNWLI